MAEKNSKNKGNGRNRNSSQKPKTYSGVVKDPQSKKINGRVYLKEDPNNNDQSTYVLLIIVTILVGTVAMIVPAGSGIIDYFSMSSHSAADVWFGIAALIFMAAAISATLDKKLK